MDYAEVKQRLSPCGLDCSRCAGYEQGEIKQLSERLLELLGGYDRLAKMRQEKQPVFSAYPQFREILTVFSQASCSGCRGSNVICPTSCSAKTCHKEKSVDFCFQCPDYPCEKQFSGKLRERWQNINDRMKEIGVVEYYYEQAKLSRY